MVRACRPACWFRLWLGRRVGGSGGGCAGWGQPADEGEPGQAHAEAELAALCRLGGVIDRAAALGVRAHIVHPQHVGLNLRVVKTKTLKHQLEPSSWITSNIATFNHGSIMSRPAFRHIRRIT